MFQLIPFKKSKTSDFLLQGIILTNLEENIRTLQEDYENSKKSEEKTAQRVLLSSQEFSNLSQETNEPKKGEFLGTISSPFKTNLSSKIPDSQNFSNSERLEKKPPSEKEIPSSFGSEKYSKPSSPFENKEEVLKHGLVITPAKTSRKSLFFIFLLVVLALVGGGTYYWWDFIKVNINKIIPQNESRLPQETEENKSIKNITLDLKTDKIANKLSIERGLKEISTNSPDNKAIEIKLISRDNKNITPLQFSKIFDFQFPASIAEKLTQDYSFFSINENGQIKTGAAFKLLLSPELAESIKNEEASFFSNFKSFYLDKSPSGTINFTFSSSKYKNADIRYFNFLSSSETSFDYTVLSDQENSYFIFGTSKNSLRAILDYMLKE